MEIRGRVQQVIVKDGKDHDLRLELHLSDEDVVQLIRWRHTDLNVVIDPIQHQTRLPGIDGESAAEEQAERFWIDECSFPIHREYDAEGEPTSEYRLTGKELRELVEPPAEQIWQIIVADSEDGETSDERRVLVEDSALIELHDGDRFSAQPEPEADSESEPDGEPAESESSPLNDSETQYAAIGAGGRGRGAE